jgi:hypothetical protein
VGTMQRCSMCPLKHRGAVLLACIGRVQLPFTVYANSMHAITVLLSVPLHLVVSLHAATVHFHSATSMQPHATVHRAASMPPRATSTVQLPSCCGLMQFPRCSFHATSCGFQRGSFHEGFERFP